MVRWGEFKASAPELVAVGEKLLYRPDRGEVAILATVNSAGRPCVAPVSPIFCAPGMYLSVGAHTPKLKHLRASGRYALHAMVGADDLEFQISGPVRAIDPGEEHDAVVAAIPFPSFDASDPMFELLIERAVVVTWPERAPRGEKRVWRAETTER